MDLEFYEKIIECPMCGGVEHSYLYSSMAGGADDQQGRFADEVPVIECSNCGFVYAQYVFNESGREEFFKNYSSEVHEESVLKVDKRQRMYQIEFDYISQWMKYDLHPRVMDVGCAEGKFLDFFSNAGCECFGVEIGEEAAEICSHKHKVYQGRLPELQIKERFRLIISRGTLQYFEEPVRYLEKMDALLEENGLIYITSLPNMDSFCHKLFKQRFGLPVCAVARNGFTPDVLKAWFLKRGYKLCGEKYFYEETPYADVLNDIRAVNQAITLKQERKEIDFVSPAFWGNQMTLVFGKYD